MRDFGTQYRTSIYNLLRNHIFIGDPDNAENIPVYADEVDDTIAPYTRDEPPKRYIILSNQNEIDDSNKETFNFVTTMQIDCVAEFDVMSGNYARSESIADAVKQILMSNHVGKLYVPGFNCWRGRVDLSRNLSEKTKVKNIYRKIIIFSHSVEEAYTPNPDQAFDYTLNFYLS